MKKIFFALAFFLSLLISPKIMSVAYVSNNSGTWSTPTIWTPNGNPGIGDTVTISAGHTITLDGSVTVGTMPGNDTTYNVSITGTLQWPENPGADWTFQANTSIAIQPAGNFNVGTGTSNRLNCANTAKIVLNTSGNVKYDMRVWGKLNLYGCENYKTSGAVGERARISACSASPCTGAVTLTLDRAVNWDTCADAEFCGLMIGNGGNETTMPAGDAGEIVTTYTNVAANQVSLTLTKTHLTGDIIAKVSRNILIKSNTAGQHGTVNSDSTGTPAINNYYLSWARFDELGDGAGAAVNQAGIGFNRSASPAGTLEYTAITNCDDGGEVDCLYFNTLNWTKMSAVYTYQTSVGDGMMLTPYQSFATKIDSCVAISDDKGGSSKGIGSVVGSNDQFVSSIEDNWISEYNLGLYLSGGGSSLIKNNIFNYNGANVSFPSSPGWGTGGPMSNNWIVIESNEFRNASSNKLFQIMSQQVRLISNNFDGAYQSCAYLYGSRVESFNNTFDRCNIENNTTYSGTTIDLYGDGASSVDAPYFYGMGDQYGVTTANNKSNMMFNFNDDMWVSAQNNCNECIFTAVTNPASAVLSTDIYPMQGASSYGFVTRARHDAYFTLHNKNGVEDAHEGWGPGGMWFYADPGNPPSGAWVDDTLRLHIKPGSAIEYHKLPLGVIKATAGQTVQVDLYVQKDEAQSAEFRPRLMLKGCGFDYNSYHEMPDTTNTWEHLTLSGMALTSGAVHVYIGVKNNLSPGSDSAPVWPPTLEVYVDGYTFSVS